MLYKWVITKWESVRDEPAQLENTRSNFKTRRESTSSSSRLRFISAANQTLPLVALLLNPVKKTKGSLWEEVLPLRKISNNNFYFHDLKIWEHSNVCINFKEMSIDGIHLQSTISNSWESLYPLLTYKIIIIFIMPYYDVRNL